jgi:hypothetical protein
MKSIQVRPDDLIVSPELNRSGRSKQFEERLRASIAEVGLAEPIKVARTPGGPYVVIDGIMRLNAISEIRATDPTAFATIPAYVVEYGRRYEIRYQTDIYQDLLPSQLAALVEHLHKSENVRKADIARYIGVSPPTVRNYTGLWRMLQRGGLFTRIVDLMDVGVIPSSNPYAWLRLTARGLRSALEEGFTGGEHVETWIDERVARARRGDVAPYPIKYIEEATSTLSPECYREGEAVRTLKRDLGLRRASPAAKSAEPQELPEALRHLSRVSRGSPEPVLRSAARSMSAYLR